MTRIGLVPMSGKPFHVGHHGLVEIASKENDEVHLFVSLSDRDIVSGKAMEQIWHEQIEPILPSNVTVTYTTGGSPVRSVFEELGEANLNGSQDVFSVYSDPEDIKNFSSLSKYAGDLLARGQIKMRPVERTSTVNVSGTQMRAWMSSGDKKNFVAHLPHDIDGDKVWNTLIANMPLPKAKKMNAKAPKKTESLLRSYIKLLLSNARLRS